MIIQGLYCIFSLSSTKIFFFWIRWHIFRFFITIISLKYDVDTFYVIFLHVSLKKQFNTVWIYLCLHSVECWLTFCAILLGMIELLARFNKVESTKTVCGMYHRRYFLIFQILLLVVMNVFKLLYEFFFLCLLSDIR